MSIRDDLKAYLDGELSDQRAAEVRAALESDPQLRAEADALKAISNTFRLVAPAPEPIGLEKTLAALERAGPVRPERNPWRVLGWSMAGVAATVIVAALVMPFFGQAKVSGDVASKAAAPSAATVEAPGEGAHKFDFRQERMQDKSLAKAKAGEASDRPTKKAEAGVDLDVESAPPAEDGLSRQKDVAGETAKAPAAIGSGPTLDTTPQPAATKSTPAALEPKPLQGLQAPTAAAKAADSNAPRPAGGGGMGGGGGRDVGVRGGFGGASVLSAKALARNSQAEAAPRFIVNNGSIGVYVTGVKDAKEHAESFARSAGGYVQTSDLRGDKPEQQTALVTLRIPVDRYAAVLARIKALGEVNRDSSTGTDVTTQVVDTEARLKTMRSEEQQYQSIMKQAKKIDDILAVKERLTDVRQQIESLESQDKTLRNQAALSTIEVEFSVKQKPQPKPVAGLVDAWPFSTVASAGQSLIEVGRAIASMVIYLLIFAPIWAPAVWLNHLGLKLTRPQYRY